MTIGVEMGVQLNRPDLHASQSRPKSLGTVISAALMFAGINERSRKSFNSMGFSRMPAFKRVLLVHNKGVPKSGEYDSALQYQVEKHAVAGKAKRV